MMYRRGWLKPPKLDYARPDRSAGDPDFERPQYRREDWAFLWTLVVIGATASFAAILGEFGSMKSVTGAARDLKVELVGGTLALTWLLGGFQSARVVHFLGMTVIVGFLLVHVALSLLVPSTLKAMVTGGPRVVRPTSRIEAET